MRKKNIFYLAGFMASGKSTIGPIVANVLGWNFFDLDKEIEKRENKKIIKIFEEDGEDYFRRKETEILRQISDSDNLIISLGGGTLIIKENREFIKKSGHLIFLNSSPETAYRRLKHKKDRPILLKDINEEESENEAMERIESLMKERMKYYKKAEYYIDTDKESIGTTADKISSLIINSSKKKHNH
jgi:shikimate kinase